MLSEERFLILISRTCLVNVPKKDLTRAQIDKLNKVRFKLSTEAWHVHRRKLCVIIPSYYRLETRPIDSVRESERELVRLLYPRLRQEEAAQLASSWLSTGLEEVKRSE